MSFPTQICKWSAYLCSISNQTNHNHEIHFYNEKKKKKIPKVLCSESNGNRLIFKKVESFPVAHQKDKLFLYIFIYIVHTIKYIE